jgi:RNA polymerase sigma-70 factor (ECF subfamily)
MATDTPPPTIGPGVDSVPAGRFEARYVAFLETVALVRPRLHRYCARMVGSVMDGEDVVQEALFQAYRKLDSYDDQRPLEPWLFRIAHNRCIDFLRRRGVREQAESAAMEPDVTPPVEPAGPALGKAVEHMIGVLPPKERASVLLKDVFDYSLEEIAELVDSTVGGVKAALNRGRSKLAERPFEPAARVPGSEHAQLLRLYVERFNQHDWDGLRDLISADAQLQVNDRYLGRLDESGYFGVYSRFPAGWRMAVGVVDGETAIVVRHADGAEWTPIRVDITAGRISALRDYWHCPWVLEAAAAVTIDS